MSLLRLSPHPVPAAHRCLLLMLLLCPWLAACTAPATPPVEAPIVGPIRLVAAKRIRAGEPLSVTILTDLSSDGRTVLLTLQSSAGIVPYLSVLHQGQAHFMLESTYTQSAGQARVTATVGRETVTQEIEIVPGPPVDPMVTAVGPRSIIAGGEEWAMLVIVPEDHLGNAVADGTPVLVRALRPGWTNPDQAELETQSVRTAHLLAAATITSRERAGRVRLGAVAGSAHSREESLLTVPAAPVPFAISISPQQQVADGRQSVEIISDPILDRYGNPMLNGTSLAFIVRDAAGVRRLLPAETIHGRAYASLQAAPLPSTLTVQALIRDTLSEPTTVTFTAAPRQEIPVGLSVEATVIRLWAGPFTGELDQFIPDGMPVHFQLAGPAPLPLLLEAVTEQGYARAELRRTALTAGGVVTLSVTAGSASGQGSFRIR